MIEISKPLEERYTWRVVYDDGQTCINENEDNSFANVDVSRAKHILLIPLAGDSFCRVNIPEGATPVFFRRRSITLDPLSGQESNRTTIHCIGWKRGDEAVYLFIHEDGSTLLTDNLQAV